VAKEEIKKLTEEFKKLNAADQCKVIMQMLSDLKQQRQEQRQKYCKENKK